MKQWKRICGFILSLMLVGGVPRFGMVSAQAVTESIPKSWDFTTVTKSQLQAGWTIKNEQASLWSLTDDGLVFTGCNGDLGAGRSDYQNMFYLSGDGSYIADTKITMSENIAGSGGKSAGLIIWQDDKNFIKLACQRVNGGRTYLQKVADGKQEFEYADNYTGTEVYFRVRKSKDTYSFYYSTDGVNYKQLHKAITAQYTAPNVALLVTRNNEDGKPITFTYKYLKFSQIIPQSWDFTTATQAQLKDSWTIRNENSNTWSLTSDGLVFTGCGGVLNNTSATYQNMFHIPGEGNYIADTKIDFSENITGSGGKSADLIIWQDDKNFIKLACQRVNGGRIYLQDVTNGEQKEYAQSYSGTQAYLRTKKDEDTYSFYYSADGFNFTMIGSYITKEYSAPQIALLVERNNETTPVTFTYKYLKVMNVNSDKITLNKDTLRLKVGETFQLNATNSEPGISLKWNSNDTAAVTVSETGLLSAKAEGYAIISASNNLGGSTSMVVSVQPKDAVYSNHQGNPYLPLWECVPDGEPYVFDDPDNPGKKRVYVYGSHDHRGNDKWCGLNHVVWSASVDDLSTWRYDGIIFESVVPGDTTQMNAPDIVELTNSDGTKTYCLYPNSTGNSAANNVAFSDRPDGPFRVKPGTSGALGNDPAVFVDDDGRVYGYWGSESGSKCAELDPKTMCTIKPGTTAKANLPGIAACNSEDFNPAEYNIVADGNERMFRFFEASSMRKVGNKYVMIWARAGHNDESVGTRQNLAYGYSDSPLGPWKYGGNIVSSAGEAVLNPSGAYSQTYMSTNIHGSICQIKDQWYIFYHRGLHGIKPRQAMVEAVWVEWDEKAVAEGGAVRISNVETTSKGFALDGLDPYREHSAGIVSYLTGLTSNDMPFSINYSRDVTSLPICNIKNGVVAGVKYFNFDKEAQTNHKTKLQLKLSPKGVDGSIDVFMRPTTAVNTPVVKTGGVITSVGEGSFKIGTVALSADMSQTMTTFEIDASKVDELDGQWGLFFTFNSSSSEAICDFDTMKFVSEIPAVINSVVSDANGIKTVLLQNNFVLEEGTKLFVSVQDNSSRAIQNICTVDLNEVQRGTGEKTISLPYALSVGENSFIKAFVWNKNLVPLSLTLENPALQN